MMGSLFPIAATLAFLLPILVALPDHLPKGFQLLASNGLSNPWQSFRPFLQSNNSAYALGFNEVGSDLHVLSVICILGNQTQETVWSANRGHGVGRDGMVVMNEEGVMEVRDGRGAIVWTSINKGKGEELLLSYSGNLVILDGQESIAWQSFDYPTDTLLQGQNFTASMKLISSSNFFLKMEPNGMGLYANMGTTSLPYWKKTADQETALIDPSQGPIYARMSEDGYLGMYQTERSRVAFITFNTYHEESINFRRLKLDEDGNLRIYYWEASSWKVDYEAVDDTCSLPSSCGAYGICANTEDDKTTTCTCPSGDLITYQGMERNGSVSMMNSSTWSHGCSLPNTLSLTTNCSSKLNETLFMELNQGVDYNFLSDLPLTNISTLQECGSACSHNCSCAAFFFSNDTKRCYLAQQPMLSLKQTSNMQKLAFLRLQNYGNKEEASSQKNHHSPSTALSVIIGVIVSLMVVFLLCIVGIWYHRRAGKGKQDEAGVSDKQPILDNMMPGWPPHFKYRQIEQMTSGFTKHVGRDLYQGMLPGGTCIVIRRLSELSLQMGPREFATTLASLAQLHHDNITHVCGLCAEKGEYMVLYELGYCTSPLKKALFMTGGETLKWEARLSVAIGVGRALSFLHEEGIVQGLVTMDSIFLDASGSKVKISDMGLWKILGVNSISSDNMNGGSEKEDTYNYGVLLLEIISGRNRLERGFLPNMRAIAMERRWRDILDKRLEEEIKEEEVMEIVRVALWCLEEEKQERPSMKEVVEALHGAQGTLFPLHVEKLKKYGKIV